MDDEVASSLRRAFLGRTWYSITCGVCVWGGSFTHVFRRFVGWIYTGFT